MEEKNDINKILEMLNKSIESGLHFEIRVEDAKTLMEYIETQNKQIGIEKTVNGMKQNNINTLSEELEKCNRVINELRSRLSQTRVEQLKEQEREIELQIQEKTAKLHRFERTIKAMTNEIEDLNAQYNFIY